VSAFFSNETVIQYDDVVGITNRAKSVCNHETSSIRAEQIERLLDRVLGNGVQCRGGFIEYDLESREHTVVIHEK
jgi:hypothetical protein